ncbi:MAG: hypothetical protein HQL64_05510 [Magnetococcales bacterium]|nr:hypothetical protein [Magnetococcales bacterium]
MHAVSRSRVFPARKRVYVDARIQMRMLIALLVLEIVLAAGGVVYLYFRFEAIIEESLYRIHHATQDIFSLLSEEMGWVVLGMLLINLAGLLAADRVWIWYVKRVLGTFTTLAVKVSDLDFSPDQVSPDQHVALDLMLAWRQKERDRARAIRTILAHADTTNNEQLAARLRELRANLPPYSHRFVGRLRTGAADS